MRIITLHCDYIKFKALKKALKSAPELKDKSEVSVKEPLVVLTAVESGDGSFEIKQLVSAVKKTAKEVKAKNIVLYPYAHLSSNLAAPEVAQKALLDSESLLSKDFKVTKAPFGYYKEFELKVKGHPLSELSKEFTPDSTGKNIEVEADPKQLLREISRAKLDTSKLKDNDHRILGQKMDLFSFNEVAPGSAFWHEGGLTIYNELLKFSRELHSADYKEISAPQILDSKLWKISGHWGHYREHMLITDYEGRPFAIKPMNCPGMMLVYKTKTRSYKDLPLRLLEFGVVHRKELSGVLAGLFRLIRFTQDDAHIFCTKEQVANEVEKILKLVKIIYKDTFNFDYSVELSTRPKKFMGRKADWDASEKELEAVLKKTKTKYKINKGDGAFYGPKIDIHIKDSLNRDWQCATIQMDMQMPERFGVKYIGKDNKEHTPIVIHRAIFGSLERFIGILLEHVSGSLPVWLSPIQARILSFTERNTKAVEKLSNQLKEEGIRVDTDIKDNPIQGKVRDAEIMKIPYIIVIGDKEEKAKTLAVRQRGEKLKFGVSADKLIKDIKDRIEKRK